MLRMTSLFSGGVGEGGRGGGTAMPCLFPCIILYGPCVSSCESYLSVPSHVSSYLSCDIISNIHYSPILQCLGDPIHAV